MNVHGDRILNVLSRLGIMELNEESSAYAEIFAVTEEIKLLKEYLKSLYEEAFVFTANNIGLSKRESIYGADMSDETVLKRRSALLKRNMIKCNCLCLENIDDFFTGLSCKGHIVVDTVDAYTIDVYITEYNVNEGQTVLENQIRGLFPVGYKVRFNYE